MICMVLRECDISRYIQTVKSLLVELKLRLRSCGALADTGWTSRFCVPVRVEVKFGFYIGGYFFIRDI